MFLKQELLKIVFYVLVTFTLCSEYTFCQNSASVIPTKGKCVTQLIDSVKYEIDSLKSDLDETDRVIDQLKGILRAKNQSRKQVYRLHHTYNSSSCSIHRSLKFCYLADSP